MKIVRAQRIVNHGRPVDLARVVMGVATLLLLVCGSLYILRPFLLALIWAITIVVATWPALIVVQHRLRDRRGPAVAVMLLALLVVIVLPLYGAVLTLTAHADDIMAVVKGLPTYSLPPPPHWIADIPLVGPRIAREWLQSTGNEGEVVTEARPGISIALNAGIARVRAGEIVIRLDAHTIYDDEYVALLLDTLAETPPVPGGVGYGMFYTPAFRTNFARGTSLYWRIICPTPPGGNVLPLGSTVAGWAPDLAKSENRVTAALLVKF